MAKFDNLLIAYDKGESSEIIAKLIDETHTDLKKILAELRTSDILSKELTDKYISIFEYIVEEGELLKRSFKGEVTMHQGVSTLQ